MSETNEKIEVTATVELVVEVRIGQPWSGAYQVGEILKTARREAVERLGSAIDNKPGMRVTKVQRVNIIGSINGDVSAT